MNTITSVFSMYSRTRFLRQSTLEQYRIAVGLFVEFAGDIDVASINSQIVADWLRHLSTTRSARTCNSKRQPILTLWRFAVERGLCSTVPSAVRVPEPRKLPTAWTVNQMRQILDACKRSRRIRYWSSEHWQALVRTIYDSSLRIGALLQIPERDVVANRIICRAQFQKQNADSSHRLSTSTLISIDLIRTGSGRLFDWPLHRRAIWCEFRTIVELAGLPATRRDLFHKIRRTSYTLVADELGFDAATRHAGHSTDMRRFYYDPTIAGECDAIQALPVL